MSGIYIHIPFCKQKCSYCDFASFANCQDKFDSYFEALNKQILQNKSKLENKVFDTIYIGGGTPSFVPSHFIVKLMQNVFDCYNIAENAEITIEINPGTLTEQKVSDYKTCGINRFSIGLQTSDDSMLKNLNRIHNASHFEYACKLLSGCNFSVDIMIGLMGQDTNKIEQSINLAHKNGASHISVYALTVEKATPIYQDYKKGLLPDSDMVANFYHFTVNCLEQLGYNQYELSNFCKPTFESKHNYNYWNRGEYIGFGLSASSFIDGKRFTATSNLNEYIDNVTNNKSICVFTESVDIESAKFEYVMLQLRTVKGLNFDNYYQIFNSQFEIDFETALKTADKYLHNNNQSIKIKKEYFFVQNEIILKFLK